MNNNNNKELLVTPNIHNHMGYTNTCTLNIMALQHLGEINET